MGDIRLLQIEHGEWLERNFPHQQPEDALLGMVEEIGELAHAHLKHSQGIRGMTHEAYNLAAGDALADLFIYMMSYCTTNGFDLEDEIKFAWKKVSARNWADDPKGAADGELA